MAVAGIAYGLVLLCIVIGLDGFAAASASTRAYLCGSFLYYLLLDFFIFDCFGIRSKIGWLQKIRGRAGYLLRCILFAAVASLIFLTGCAIILLMIFPSA